MAAAPDSTQPSALRFSIIVPAFNGAETLPKTLESALRQTHPPHEVIVVDDGSTDGTAAVAESFAPPVVVLRQPNGGTASARNRGLRHVTGDVVCFLDADDLYEPDRLEQIAARFAAEPELDAIATEAELASAESSRLASVFGPDKLQKPRLDFRAPIIFCTLAVRRHVLDEVGGFSSRYSILEDLDLWYRIACRGYAVGYIDKPSYIYRIHPKSKTQTRSSVDGYLEFALINLSHALARKTPHRYRPRLVVRALRHGRSALRAWAAAR